MKLLRLFHLPHRFFYAILYKLRFRRFGWRSTVRSPLHLIGCRNIAVGNRVTVAYKAWLQALPLTGADVCSLELQDGVTIGNFNHIIATQKVVLEKNVLTADSVYISDNFHGFEDIHVPIQNQPIVQCGEVVIGEDSWLGEHVCVLGVHIGKHCVIGANSVVTKDIPDYCVAVGAPARIIKRYDFDTSRWCKTDAQGNFV